jgi:2-hydroxy-5-methyl-1-naphthoate 7-hydroxylase
VESREPLAIDRTGKDIHAEARQIRSRGQVAPIELPGGVPAYSVIGHDAARQVLADHRFSKDPRKHWTAYARGEIGEDFPLIGWVLMDNLTTKHGADHTRLRKLTAKAFTPRRVEAMRTSIEKIATTLLDALPTGEVTDLRAHYAHPLPAQVICDLFGVPAESRAQMLRGGEVNADTTISPEESAANVVQWEEEMREFVASKRKSPGDDLTSDLIAAHEDGSRLTDSELVGTLHLLLATGTTPVMNLVTNATAALLTHPEQADLVLSGQVPWQAAIEETLRVDAPVAHLPFRFTVEDVEVAGTTIPQGSPVLIHFAGIGRDPEVHGETADRFDVTRQDKTNLSFGHGIYRCIGAPLAWLETEIALSALFERFPKLDLAVRPEELEPQGTFIMNGRETLPVRLTGQAQA